MCCEGEPTLTDREKLFHITRWQMRDGVCFVLVNDQLWQGLGDLISEASGRLVTRYEDHDSDFTIAIGTMGTKDFVKICEKCNGDLPYCACKTTGDKPVPLPRFQPHQSTVEPTVHFRETKRGCFLHD